jgi:hydrogenase maturation protease
VHLLDSPLAGQPSPFATNVASHRGTVLVLGVGNVLMGDEGVGVHAIRRLELEPRIPDVLILDGGTGGVNLLAQFDGVAAMILVDATRDGRRDGAITYLAPQHVVDLPRGLGAHDFGLKDLFAAAALLGRLPRLHLYTVSVSQIRPMCTELSDPVAAAIPPLAWTVHGHAARLAAEHAAARKTASAARTLPTDAEPPGL